MLIVDADSDLTTLDNLHNHKPMGNLQILPFFSLSCSVDPPSVVSAYQFVKKYPVSGGYTFLVRCFILGRYSQKMIQFLRLHYI